MYSDMIPTERAAIVTARLLSGRQMTVREVAEMVEMTDSGARKLLERLSRVLPLSFDDAAPANVGGVWRINSGGDDGEVA